MRLSIFTTITNPIKRQDAWQEAIESYLKIADEVVVVDGGSTDGTFEKLALMPVQIVNYYWPDEWEWIQLPKALNEGLKNCTGDWVIKADIDYVFHEKRRDLIRKKLKEFNDYPVVNFHKWQFLLVDRYNLKSRCPIAINKKKFPNVKFGIPVDKESDLCQPIFVTEDGEIPKGFLVDKNRIPDTRIEFFNYDFCFKDKETITNDFWRFAKAHKTYYPNDDWGDESPEKAFAFFEKMMRNKLLKETKKISLEEHPKSIQNTIKFLDKSKFGYSAFGWAEVASYYENSNNS